MLGLMALRDGFGSLRSIGGGPAGPQNALPMAMQYRAQQAEQEKLQQALERAKGGGALPMGMNPAAFEALSSVDPRAALGALAQVAKPAAKPSSVQEYEYAKNQGFGGTYQDWVRAKAEAGRTSIENNIGGQGNYTYGKLDPGWRVNNETGVASPIPGSAAAREIETSAATAQAETEKSVNVAQGMIDNIDAILTDEALPYATGVFAPLQNIPGTGAYRFGTKSRQLQGKAFLQAIDTLKGTGQITEIEGKKATEAVGRLDTALSEEDYIASLTELKGILQEGQGRAITGGVSPRANPNFNAVPLNSLSDADLDAEIRRLQGQ